MKRFLLTFTLAVTALSCAAAASAQTATTNASATNARAAQHLIGDTPAVPPSGGQITGKSDAGPTINVTTNEKTVYRRVPPGETSTAKAETITRADVRAGDRVLVPNGAAASAGVARQVIVMAREAIASKRQQEQQDWRARGVRGRVAAVDPAKKEITVETGGPRGGMREGGARAEGPGRGRSRPAARPSASCVPRPARRARPTPCPEPSPTSASATRFAC